MRLWERDYSLYLGWDAKSGREGILVKDLNIEFKVNKVISNRLNPSSSTIKIYNLSAEQSSVLQKQEVTVRLMAGYKDQENGMLEICVGQVVKVQTTKNGTDRITTLEVGEGYGILHNVRLNETIPSGMSVRGALKAIASAANLSVSDEDITGKGADKILSFGMPLSGTVKDNLDKITQAHYLDYSIIGNRLLVRQTNGAVDRSRSKAFVYNQDSGMIDIPYFEKWTETEKVEKADDIKWEVKGMKMKALLNPAIVPGSIIKLDRQGDDNEVKNGVYLVREVIFSGEYRGSEWSVEVKCENAKELK